MITKKRMALLTVLLAVLFFVILLFLPKNLMGIWADNNLHFAINCSLLSLFGATSVTMLLIIIFNNGFLRRQIKSFRKFRYTLYILIKCDFVVRYRKSFLGVLWSFLNPLLTMLVMAFVFSFLLGDQVQYYPAYILCGHLVFNFFSTSTTQAMNSIIYAGGILHKIYVPRYIFPISSMLSAVVNMFLALTALLFVAVFTGVPFQWTQLLMPIPIIYFFVFTLGISLIMSTVAVFFRDITQFYGVLVTLLMYLSAIFYPIDIIPGNLQPLMELNPIFHYIRYFRSLFLEGIVPGLLPNAICIGFALASLFFGTYVFISKQDRFILYI